jgi:hypothetical protein
MDALSTFLDGLKKSGIAQGHLLGLLNVVVGRRITAKDGTVVSRGLTWREMAVQLKRVRWEPEQVGELGFDSNDLPPRDRQRYWYTAIARARVDSAEATAAGDLFAELLRKQGYDVSATPTADPLS